MHQQVAELGHRIVDVVAEDRLAQMKLEYNNGQPERKGDEKNYQRYVERVNDMKAALARKENDIASIRRELSKLPS